MPFYVSHTYDVHESQSITSTLLIVPCRIGGWVGLGGWWFVHLLPIPASLKHVWHRVTSNVTAVSVGLITQCLQCFFYVGLRCTSLVRSIVLWWWLFVAVTTDLLWCRCQLVRVDTSSPARVSVTWWSNTAEWQQRQRRDGQLSQFILSFALSICLLSTVN